MKIYLQHILILGYLSSLSSLSSIAQAQTSALYPAESFGNPNKALAEASSDEAQKEVLITEFNHFEEVRLLPTSDDLRYLGKSVGMLDILLQTDDGRTGVVTCTATRIGKYEILTNYHCAPGGVKEGQVLDITIHFGFLERVKMVGNEFDVSLEVIDGDKNLDFAVLKLEEYVPEDLYPALNMSSRMPQDAESLFLIHHPRSQPQRLSRVSCYAANPTINSQGEMQHRCNTLPGSSGSSVFAMNDRTFVGIHHSGTPDPVSPLNFGTPVSALLNNSSTLRSLIDSKKTDEQEDEKSYGEKFVALVVSDIEISKNSEKIRYNAKSYNEYPGNLGRDIEIRNLGNRDVTVQLHYYSVKNSVVKCLAGEVPNELPLESLKEIGDHQVRTFDVKASDVFKTSIYLPSLVGADGNIKSCYSWYLEGKGKAVGFK